MAVSNFLSKGFGSIRDYFAGARQRNAARQPAMPKSGLSLPSTAPILGAPLPYQSPDVAGTLSSLRDFKPPTMFQPKEPIMTSAVPGLTFGKPVAELPGQPPTPAQLKERSATFWQQPSTSPGFKIQPQPQISQPTVTEPQVPIVPPTTATPPAAPAAVAAPAATPQIPSPAAAAAPSSSAPAVSGTTGGTGGTQVPLTAGGLDPATKKAIDDAEKAFQDANKISSEELSTQEDLDKLIESTKKAYLNTQQQPIALEFITGQLKSIEQRAQGLAEPLDRKLARLQAKRQASSESSKFALERADKQAERERGKAGEAFTLGAGETRYSPTGQVLATGPAKPAETKAPTTIETAQGIMQWDPATGTFKDTGFTKAQSDTATEKAAEKAEAATKGKSSALDNYSLVNELLSNPGVSKISGYIQGKLGLGSLQPGAQTALNLFDQVKGILALSNRQQLKGSGAVSDFESKTLEKAASSLGRNLNDAEFKKQLSKIRGAFATAAGLEASIRVTNKNTGETISTTASRGEIDQAIAAGHTVEYE